MHLKHIWSNAWYIYVKWFEIKSNTKPFYMWNWYLWRVAWQIYESIEPFTWWIFWIIHIHFYNGYIYTSFDKWPPWMREWEKKELKLKSVHLQFRKARASIVPTVFYCSCSSCNVHHRERERARHRNLNKSENKKNHAGIFAAAKMAVKSGEVFLQDKHFYGYFIS